VVEIEYGSRVIARSADDQDLDKRALTGVVMGEDFPVIWVCREEEWSAAAREGREPVGVPWPADAVTPSEEAAA
jgi:hypothetical protein